MKKMDMDLNVTLPEHSKYMYSPSTVYVYQCVWVGGCVRVYMQVCVWVRGCI